MVCLQTKRGNASFYKWRAKYGGMDASMISLVFSRLRSGL